MRVSDVITLSGSDCPLGGNGSPCPHLLDHFKWRWRLIYLRGVIDSQLAQNGGKMEGDILRNAFAELTTLYHAENAHPYTKPFQIP